MNSVHILSAFDQPPHPHHQRLGGFKVAVEGGNDVDRIHCVSPQPMRPVM